jgi:hypothetical protein
MRTPSSSQIATIMIRRRMPLSPPRTVMRTSSFLKTAKSGGCLLLPKCSNGKALFPLISKDDEEGAFQKYMQLNYLDQEIVL